MITTFMVDKARERLSGMLEPAIYPEMDLVPVIQYIIKCSREDAESIEKIIKQEV